MTMDDAEPSTDAADEPEIQADEEWKQQVKVCIPLNHLPPRGYPTRCMLGLKTIFNPKPLVEIARNHQV